MNDDQFQELTRRFGKLEKRLDEQDETVLKLYQHIEQRFDQLDIKLETKADRNQVDQSQRSLDDIVSRFNHDDTERVALADKAARHEQWIDQLADNTGTKLVPEL
jgi:hypothetical protein